MNTKSFIAVLLIIFSATTFARRERECRYFAPNLDNGSTIGMELLLEKNVELAPDAESADIVMIMNYRNGIYCKMNKCTLSATASTEAKVKVNGNFISRGIESEHKNKNKDIRSKDLSIDITSMVESTFNDSFKKLKRHKCYEETEVNESGREILSEKSGPSISSSNISNASAQ